MSKKNQGHDIPNWLKKARNKWEFNGQKRPAFAVEPMEGQRSVWDFPRPPAVEKVSKVVEVKKDQNTIAKTAQAFAVLETASPPTYYIPPEDINFEMLQKIFGKNSLCEWKGKAEYWTLKGEPSQAIAWSYSNPFPEFRALMNFLAFYPQYVECFVDGERVIPQPGGFYAGWITSDLVGPFKGEPGTGQW